ncbi:MAG: radical SAM protein [Phycisphaerales bacterium]|nr:MAG: radical SAM protein [Phycisphaerales bacterium]
MPAKVCTLDCVYCQVGKTTKKTVERADFVCVEKVLSELREKLAAGHADDLGRTDAGEKGPIADFITIGGSGEPTLNSRLGELIDRIRQVTDIPVAVLTNGTLLDRSDVRADCAKADVVLPSLDAGDEQTFQKVNRPHELISIGRLISGLCAFRSEFSGQIWLEVFLVDGLNTDAEQISRLKDVISQIRPDKIQINTAVRPGTEMSLGRVECESLKVLAAQLGPSCEVIADFSHACHVMHGESGPDDVLSMLKRRPCSLNDVCSGLGIDPDEALKYVSQLQEQGLIGRETKGAVVFFKALP